MQNLVRVSEIPKLAIRLPFKAQTFYKWFHIGKYSEIFVKFGGSLFVDLDRLEQLIEASRASTVVARNRNRKSKKRSQAGKIEEAITPASVPEAREG